jgi:asparagine synthase (glutamine-hydrolysing)
MPLSYKKKRTQGKYLIKKTAEKYFSRQFIYKRKEGFGVPLEKWFVQDATMGSYVDMLLEPKTLQRGFYRKESLKKLAQSARQGSLSPGEYECLLWTAVNFELWNRIFIDGEVMSHA